MKAGRRLLCHTRVSHGSGKQHKATGGNMNNTSTCWSSLPCSTICGPCQTNVIYNTCDYSTCSIPRSCVEFAAKAAHRQDGSIGVAGVYCLSSWVWIGTWCFFGRFRDGSLQTRPLEFLTMASSSNGRPRGRTKRSGGHLKYKGIG